MPAVKYSSLYTHTQLHMWVSVSRQVFRNELMFQNNMATASKTYTEPRIQQAGMSLEKERSCQTDEVVLCISFKSLRNTELSYNQHVLRTLSSQTQDVFFLDKGTSCSSLKLICLCIVWTPEYNEMSFKYGQTQLKHLTCINTVVFIGFFFFFFICNFREKNM